MDSIGIYKMTFDFDDGYNSWDKAIEHVAASSPQMAQAALLKYLDDMYGEDAVLQRIHSVEKLVLTDGMVLVNENHLEE